MYWKSTANYRPCGGRRWKTAKTALNRLGRREVLRGAARAKNLTNRPASARHCGGISRKRAFGRHFGGAGQRARSAPDCAGKWPLRRFAKPGAHQGPRSKCCNAPRAKPARTQTLTPREAHPRHGKPRKKAIRVIAAVAALLVLVVAVSAIVRFRQPGKSAGDGSASGVHPLLRQP